MAFDSMSYPKKWPTQGPKYFWFSVLAFSVINRIFFHHPKDPQTTKTVNLISRITRTCSKQTYWLKDFPCSSQQTCNRVSYQKFNVVLPYLLIYFYFFFFFCLSPENYLIKKSTCYFASSSSPLYFSFVSFLLTRRFSISCTRLLFFQNPSHVLIRWMKVGKIHMAARH